MAKKIDLKAKAKRQKIVAAVLGVLLLAVLAYEVPSLLKVMNKKAPPPPVIAAPAPAGTPVTGAPTGAPVSAPTTLADSDPTAHAGSGQLVSFDRFSSKDPFVQQANAVKAAPAPAKPAVAPPPPPPPPAATGQPAAKPTSAKIAINGAREDVKVGGNFPSSDPVFTLVSLTKKTAKVGIAGGTLSTGTGTVTLTKGKKLTLMNTADGTRYELVLVSVA